VPISNAKIKDTRKKMAAPKALPQFLFLIFDLLFSLLADTRNRDFRRLEVHRKAANSQ
jgi:hypothetical protein